MIRSINKALCLLAVTCVSLLAQNAAGTGGISGIVTDASGAVVPGAQVIVENESKGIRRELTTTGAGVFSAPSLVPAPGYTGHDHRHRVRKISGDRRSNRSRRDREFDPQATGSVCNDTGGSNSRSAYCGRK